MTSELDIRSAIAMGWDVVDLIFDRQNPQKTIYLWDGENTVVQFPGGEPFFFSPTTNPAHIEIIKQFMKDNFNINEHRNFIDCLRKEVCKEVDMPKPNDFTYLMDYTLFYATPQQITAAFVAAMEARE